MGYLNIVSRYKIWTLSILLLGGLALATVGCSEAEPTKVEDPMPTAAVPATEAPTLTPTATPEPERNTPTPTSAPTEAQTEAATPTRGPEMTPVTTREPTPEPEPEPAAYPVETVDMMGRTVSIHDEPVRIVSISPTSTEILYAAGGTAIARDSSSNYPSGVDSLPEVGGAYSPSFESIAAQRPDLILVEALTQGRFVGPLSQFGAPVVAVRATSLEDITVGIRLIGQIVNNEAIADQAIREISGRISSAVEDLTEGGSALILISDADRNLYAAKPQSYPGAIASMVYLSNPAADLPDSGTFPGFALISAEQILTMDPDYLFTITPAPQPVPRLSATLLRIPPFANLRAIRNGQLHEIDHVIFLRNQGPRIAEAVEAMAELTGGSP